MGVKGHREEGLHMDDISKEELIELQDTLKTEKERGYLEGSFKDASMLYGLIILFMVTPN